MNENTENINDSVSIFSDKKMDSAIEKSKIWVQFLAGKWVYIVLFCFIGIIAGIIYAKKQSIQFESYLTFSLDEASRSSGGGLSSLVAQFGIGTPDNNLFSGDNIVEVIKSRTILERVLLSTDSFNGKAVTMIDYFNQIQSKNIDKETSSKNAKIFFSPGFTKATSTYQQDSVLFKVYGDILKNNLIASRPDKQLNIYVIKFKSPNEKYTKIFTDKILSETTKFYTELKTKKSESTLKVLEQRIAAIKGNLNESISSKASSQDANVNPAFAAAQVPLQKQQLNMQVYGTAYGELYKNLELARFQFLQDIPLLQVINNSDYPMKKLETGWVKSALAGGFLFTLFSIFLFTLFHIIRRRNH